MLKIRQKALLIKFQKETKIHWHDQLYESFNDSCFYVCNEFFDAFPFNQYSLNGKKKIILKDKKLTSIFIPNNNPYNLKDKRDIVETSLIMKKTLFKIFGKIKKNGGVFLLIDYGPLEKGKNDSIQAIHKNSKCNFLDFPCKSDITHHVDFLLIKKIARKFNLNIYGPINQSKFLSFFGINERIKSLLSNTKNLKQKEKIEEDFDRLTSYSKMGELYKCIIFSDIELHLPF